MTSFVHAEGGFIPCASVILEYQTDVACDPPRVRRALCLLVARYESQLLAEEFLCPLKGCVLGGAQSVENVPFPFGESPVVKRAEFRMRTTSTLSICSIRTTSLSPTLLIVGLKPRERGQPRNAASPALGTGKLAPCERSKPRNTFGGRQVCCAPGQVVPQAAVTSQFGCGKLTKYATGEVQRAFIISRPQFLLIVDFVRHCVCQLIQSGEGFLRSLRLGSQLSAG